MYRLEGRYFEGVRVVGYVISDERGNKTNVANKEILMLAAQGMIDKCRVVSVDGEMHLRSDGVALSSLPKMNIGGTGEFKITYRILNGNVVKGYGVVDRSGKNIKLSREKVWELARDKRIVNAKATLSNNTKILIGVGMELKNLPAMREG